MNIYIYEKLCKKSKFNLLTNSFAYINQYLLIKHSITTEPVADSRSEIREKFTFNMTIIQQSF